MKVLPFDGGGYWVWSRRLEAGPLAASLIAGLLVDRFRR